MEELSWRPLISGLLGGLVTLWLFGKWSGRVPTRVGSKDAATLRIENRWRTLGANACFFGVILVGVIFFKGGYFAPNDWTRFLLIVGLACVAPVSFLFFSALPMGIPKVREAFAAYAISQRTPLFVLIAIWTLGLVSLLIAVMLIAGS